MPVIRKTLLLLTNFYNSVPKFNECFLWKRLSLPFVDSHKSVGRYLKKIIDLLLQGALLVFATSFLLLVVLTFCKAAAFLYLNARVGQEFTQINPELARLVVDVQWLSPTIVGGRLVGTCLWLGLAFGAVFRFFQLMDSFYLSRGLVSQVTLFGSILAAITTAITYEDLQLHWQVVFFFALVPACSLVHFCFRAAQDALPELETVVSPSVRLTVAWGILHESLVVLLVAMAATFSCLVAYQYLFNHYADVIGRHLPPPFHQARAAINEMGIVETVFFCGRLVFSVYLTGVAAGIMLQILGLFPWLAKRNHQQRSWLLGIPLALFFLLLLGKAAGPFTSFSALAVVLVPAIFLSSGCLFVGHALVCNIPWLKALEKKVDCCGFKRRPNTSVNDKDRPHNWPDVK